jgi:hypothetical protein
MAADLRGWGGGDRLGSGGLGELIWVVGLVFFGGEGDGLVGV